MVKSTSGGSRSSEITRGPTPRPAPAGPTEGPRAEGHKIFARVVDRETNQPIGNARYEVVNAQGAVIAQGHTDYTGTVRHDVPAGGQYTIRVVEVPPASGGAAPAGGDGAAAPAGGGGGG